MGSERVAYVDEGVAEQSRVVDALSGAGFDVEAFDDPDAVVAAVQEVDCIVSAYGFDGDDGVALCERVRLHRPDVPFVIYAGAGSASAASAAFAAGASDYVLREEVPPAELPGRVESALDRADGQYRRLVEAIGDMVYAVDEEGRIVMLNDSAVDLSGYSREEAVGEHVSLLMTDDDLAASEEVVRDLLSADGPETVTYEMDVLTRSGERVPVENHAALLPMPDGEYRGPVGVLRDVSDRVDRDRRLRELHHATRELMAAEGADAIASVTVEAVDDVLEYPINGVRFLRDGALVPASIPRETRDATDGLTTYAVDGTSPAAAAYRRGEPLVYDDVRAVDDGRDRGEVRSAMYLPLGDHGTLSIGALDVGAFDEVDRQLATVLAANATAALDRFDQRAELEEERDRLAALFENIPDPTIYVEFEEGVPLVRDANPAFEEVFGLDADALDGEVVDDYIVPTDESVRNAREYNQHIQSGEIFHGEVRRRASDGLRDFLLHVVPYAVGERSTRGFAIYTDITAQKERERQLRRQNDRLEEFAGVVSHDLRNPLNVALGRLKLARETGDDAEFDAVENALFRMEELVEGLLELARQGRTVGEYESIDLEHVARLAWETVETGNADLVVEGLPRIRADEDRLLQLFENLFRNSVEHGSADNRTSSDDAVEHGGPDVTVMVGTLGDGFFVADDGPGIAESEREKVFDFGYSAADGTGFGLAIVREIAEAHGWTISIGESADGGVAFEITGVSRASSPRR